LVMNRPFRNVGEMGYAFRGQPFRTLSFFTDPSPDAALLELFSVNDYSAQSPTPTPSTTPTPTPRAGVINLNSHQPEALAAMVAGAIQQESATAPSLVGGTAANSVGNSLASLNIPITNKGGLATLIRDLPESSSLGPSQPKTQREVVARALGEAGQTRTWNLLIDVIAQTGRFPPNATSLQNGFVVTGEQRYWVHVAIDRFTNQVIAKVIEPVNE
jgi:hypothetical protein